MQLIIMVLWLDLIIISRLKFPHKKKIEQLNHYYEHVLAEKREQIEELQAQEFVLNKEIEQIKQDTKKIEQDTKKIEEETETIKKEIKVKKETINRLEKHVYFLENA